MAHGARLKVKKFEYSARGGSINLADYPNRQFLAPVTNLVP
jgi:hypothetical protein